MKSTTSRAAPAVAKSLSLSRGSSHHHRKPERKVTSLLRLALLTVWTVAAFLSFVLDLVADVFQANTPVFPLTPVVSTSIGLEVIATTVTVIYGCVTIKGYHLFQPFAGGQTFVLMQCAGFCLGVIVAVSKVVLLEVHPHLPDAHSRRVPAEAVLGRNPYGAFASLAIFGLFAQALLIGSHKYFKRAAGSASTSTDGSASATSWKNSLSEKPYRDYLLVAVCDTVVLLCTTVAAYQSAFHPVNVAVLLAFTTIKVVLLQWSTAPSIVPSYRLFQPFTAGAPYRIIALQCTADLLLLGFYGDIVLLYNAGPAAPPSWHVRCALIGMMATTFHALLLRLLQFVWQNYRVLEDKLANASAGAAAPVSEETVADLTSVETVALSGPVSVCSGVAVGTALVVFGVQGFLDVFPAHSADSVHALRLLIQFLLVVLLMLPPFTLLQGNFLHGKRFSLWESHRGSLDYLLAQVGGWWCYGSAFFCAVLQLTQAEMSPSLLLLSTACALFSQLLIHSALYLFADSSASATASPASRPTVATYRPKEGAGKDDQSLPTIILSSASGESSPTTLFTDDGSSAGSYASPTTQSPEQRSAIARVLNAEMLAAMALALLSLLLRLVYDMVIVFSSFSDHAHGHSASAGAKTDQHVASLFEKRHGVFYFAGTTPLTRFLSFSRWLALAAPVVAHLSMRDRIPLLHGSSLANGYVALQTLGWLAYMVIAASTVTYDVVGVPLLVMPWLKTAPHSTTTVRLWGRELSLESTETLTGLLYCLPFLCVFCSSVIETSFDLVRSRVQQEVAKSTDALLSVVAQHESSQDVLRQCEEYVYAIAGPRLAERRPQQNADGSARTYARSTVLAREEEAEKAALADAAHYTTVLTSVAAVIASAFAFIASDAQPAMTLLLSTAAVLVGIFSCATLQSVYGRRYHRRSGGFGYFMPFAGGRRFVLWQSCGWVSLAICISVMIACYLEGRVSHLAIAILTVTNVLAQGILCESIPLFDPEAGKDLTGTILGTYAEAILTVVTLLATFFFIKFYSLATERRATSQVTSLVPLVFSAIAMCLVIPFGLLSLQRQAVVYGLPTPLRYVRQAQDASSLDRSLRRAAAASSRPDLDADEENNNDDDDNDDDDEDSQGDIDCNDSEEDEATMEALARSRGGSHADLTGAAAAGGPSSKDTDRLAASTATPLLERWNSCGSPWDVPTTASQPGSPLFAPNSPTAARRRLRRQRRARQNAVWMRATYVLAGVLAVFVALLIPFGIAFVAYAYTYSALPTLKAAVWALQMLSLAFASLIVFPILLTSLLGRSRIVRNVHSAVCSFLIYSIPTITVVTGLSTGPLFQTRGAWLFSLNMVLLAVFSTLPHVLVTSFVFIVSSLGYIVYYHFYECLYERKYPFLAWQCPCDLAIGFFWMWYSRRYLGRPHLTGRLQSDAFTSFFRRYFFEGMSYYFSLRVIRSDTYALPQEKGQLSANPQLRKVDLSNPDNQYIFSFHPHGVFPGSALFVPKTTLWEKTVGRNKNNFISTHCADVVFSVPIMREFPLGLGAMSVSRRGIENSLKRGNSPLIVTGGQSEMLLTRMSDTEMHLVCHHLGFLKIALHNKVPLVPLLSFSESNILDNVHCIHVQRWFLKRIGFPFPTLPRGRWGLPLPTSKPLTVVIGQPIYPLPGRDDPNDPACLDELRTRYFEHLEVLFYKYRAEAGYPDMKLYLHNGIYNEGVLAIPPETDAVSLANSMRQASLGKGGATAEAHESTAAGEEGEELLTRQNSAVRRAMAVPARPKKNSSASASATAAPPTAKKTQ